MIIYDDHKWWSYMMIIYDDHLWWSYMMIIYDDHLGVIWRSSGRHLGVIWDPFGSHLGSIWRHLGGWRLKRHLEARSHIMCLTLEQNAKVLLKCKLYDMFLRVPSIMAAYLQLDLLAGSVTDPADFARPLNKTNTNTQTQILNTQTQYHWIIHKPKYMSEWLFLSATKSIQWAL